MQNVPSDTIAIGQVCISTNFVQKYKKKVKFKQVNKTRFLEATVILNAKSGSRTIIYNPGQQDCLNSHEFIDAIKDVPDLSVYLLCTVFTVTFCKSDYYVYSFISFYSL